MNQKQTIIKNLSKLIEILNNNEIHDEKFMYSLDFDVKKLIEILNNKLDGYCNKAPFLQTRFLQLDEINCLLIHKNDPRYKEYKVVDETKYNLFVKKGTNDLVCFEKSVKVDLQKYSSITEKYYRLHDAKNSTVFWVKRDDKNFQDYIKKGLYLIDKRDIRQEDISVMIWVNKNGRSFKVNKNDPEIITQLLNGELNRGRLDVCTRISGTIWVNDGTKNKRVKDNDSIKKLIKEGKLFLGRI